MTAASTPETVTEQRDVVGPVDGRVVPRYTGLSTFARLRRIEDVEDLAELAPRARRNAIVVPNGVDASFTPDGRRAEGAYVLTVGTLEPRTGAVESTMKLLVFSMNGQSMCAVQYISISAMPNAALTRTISPTSNESPISR